MTKIPQYLLLVFQLAELCSGSSFLGKYSPATERNGTESYPKIGSSGLMEGLFDSDMYVAKVFDEADVVLATVCENVEQKTAPPVPIYEKERVSSSPYIPPPTYLPTLERGINGQGVPFEYSVDASLKNEQRLISPPSPISQNNRDNSAAAYHPGERWYTFAPLQISPLYPPNLFHPAKGVQQKDSSPKPKLIVKEEQQNVLERCLPKNSLSEPTKTAAIKSKITDARPKDLVPLSRTGLRVKNRPTRKRAPVYISRKFEPTNNFGVIALVAGPQQCDKGRIKFLQFRRRKYGIRVEEDSFQVIPELKFSPAKDNPEKKPNEKRAKPKKRTVKDCSEEYIKSLFADGRNEGGIIGKFDDDHLKIYSSAKAFYRAFLYNGNLITNLEPDSKTLVGEGDILFIVPDGVTEQMINGCLKEKDHTEALRYIIGAFYNAFQLRGDFVIATIGRRKDFVIATIGKREAIWNENLSSQGYPVYSPELLATRLKYQAMSSVESRTA